MRRVISILMMLTAGLVAFAQSSIKVQAPNVVALDEQFNITFIIEGENSPSDFSWEAGDDFQLVWGPQRGTSTSVSIVNGKRTKSSQSTFTYVLMPRKTGSFQIPEARASVKGSTITSGRTVVEVVSGGQTSGGASQGYSNDSESRTSSNGEIDAGDLFLRLTLSRTSVVVGEPVNATLKLYQRVNIAGFEDARFPQFTGFWSQEVLAPTNIEFQRESYNDKIYNTAVLRSWVIIPQQSGEVEIEPAELVCLVNIRTGSISNSIFDSFFQDDYRTIRKRIYSQSYKLKVSPLPAGAPASFGGGVGSFKMTASLDRDSLKTHEAASLKIIVAGNGNVSLLEAPKVSFPPDFEVYDTKSSENTDKSNGRTSGSKTFEYPFIPRSHGDFTVGPIEYSYYDVNAHKYVTLTAPSITIEVLKGAETSAGPVGTQLVTSSRKDVKDLGTDIRFISTKMPKLSSGSAFFFGTTLFWVLLLVMIALAAVTYFALRGFAARRADTAGTRNRKASKMARRRLAQAGDFLMKNLYTAFYEELHRALQGYISDKLNMDIADMSKDNITRELLSRGVGEDLAVEFNKLLDACEFARYSPSEGHDAMDSHYKSALEVISSIDETMKSKKSSVAPILIMFLLLSPMALRAQQNDYPDSLWSVGVEAYEAEQWQQAGDAWEGIAELGLSSPELFYNIGNAYFRQENFSRAILNYERALRLDPSYEAAQHNLAFANEFIQDKIETVPELFFEAWGRKMCWKLSSNTWALLFFIFFALALGLAVTFFLSSGRARKISFYTGIAVLLIALVCVDFAQWQRTDSIRNTSAIVMRAVTSVKSSPSSASAKDLFILHEGTKVKILDTVGEWSNIELSDGRQGWVGSSDMELI